MNWSSLGVRPKARFYLIVVLAVVTTVTGMATGFGLFYRLLYLLIGTAIVGYAWNWLSMRKLGASAERGTRQALVGDLIKEEITVRNDSPVPKHALEVRDLTNMPGHAGGNVVSLYGGNTQTWPMEIRARKRGAYSVGPVEIANGDPFGLFRRERRFGNPEDVLIFPRTHSLPEFEIPPADISGDSSVRRRSHTVTPHASSVRDYAPGDSLSRVHWASSARMGKLMSKEFDLGRAAEVWVVVDLEESTHAGEFEESTDEYAVSIAASLAKRYLEANLPVGLLAYGDERYFLAAETGTGQYQRVMEYLALSKAEGTTPLEENLPHDEPLWTHLSTVIVITSSPRVEWTTALRAMMRRGIKLVVVLVDAASFGADFNTTEVLGPLAESGLAAYVVGKGDDISTALGSGRWVRGPQAREAAAVADA